MKICLLVGSLRWGGRRTPAVDGWEKVWVPAERVVFVARWCWGTHRDAHSSFLARPTHAHCPLLISIYPDTSGASPSTYYVGSYRQYFEHFGIYFYVSLPPSGDAIHAFLSSYVRPFTMSSAPWHCFFVIFYSTQLTSTWTPEQYTRKGSEPQVHYINLCLLTSCPT